MTRISFENYRDTYIFECCGHTGYASAGRDILCSAVSVLCYTLASYLEKQKSEGALTSFLSDFSEGYARMSFDISDTADERSITEAVRAILFGFALLEESFPDHIDTDI